MGAGAAIGTVGAGLTLANNVADTVDTTIQTACTEYQKGESAANAVIGAGIVPAKIASDVSVIEQYGDAACANPPSGNALSTAIWFGKLIGQLDTLVSGKTAS
jgi:hypothetical protein